MEALDYFQEMSKALINPEIDRWKNAGKRVVGTVCSNIPDEVLYAADLLPLRLRAPGLQDTSTADSHLHRINCSYTRSILEMLLRGQTEFLDGIVATNTCDHMLRLAGELQDKAKMPFVHYFSMYHTLSGTVDQWFVLEMEKMIQHMKESFSVEVSDDDLRRSISVYNRTRQLIGELNEARKTDPPAVSGAEYMRIALTGMSIPKENFNKKLEDLLSELKGRSSGEAGQPRLMIIGGACDAPEFVDFIEQRGARVVADTLCYGTRYYQQTINEAHESPLQAIADRYLERIACPSIIDGFDHSYPILEKAVKEWRIDGIICARLKFCDHWAGFRKLLAQKIRGNGVPVLELEREYSTTGSGQISTRVQAFLEMIGS